MGGKITELIDLVGRFATAFGAELRIRPEFGEKSRHRPGIEPGPREIPHAKLVGFVFVFP